MRMFSLRKSKSLRPGFDEECISVSEDKKRVPSGDEASRSPRCTDEGTPQPETPDVRQEKVDWIRREIAEGRYHVSSADLARKLIVHMLRNAG